MTRPDGRAEGVSPHRLADGSRTTADDLLREARARIDRLSPAQAARALEYGAVLIDTRCQEDRLREGIVPGSVHIPRTVLEWRADPASEHRDERIADLEARLIVMCNDGFSSSLAAANLGRMGFVNIADVEGGYRAWRSAGFLVEEIS